MPQDKSRTPLWWSRVLLLTSCKTELQKCEMTFGPKYTTKYQIKKKTRKNQWRDKWRHDYRTLPHPFKHISHICQQISVDYTEPIQERSVSTKIKNKIFLRCWCNNSFRCIKRKTGSNSLKTRRTFNWFYCFDFILMKKLQSRVRWPSMLAVTRRWHPDIVL